MVNEKIIVDTGPLVAFLNRRDQHHDWVKLQLATIPPPLITCEAVISEACFLLRKIAGAHDALLECIHNNLIEISFDLKKEVTAIKKMIAQYRTIPMSFADACLVRLAEQYPHSRILTLDSDFAIYRKNGRQTIPILMPK